MEGTVHMLHHKQQQNDIPNLQCFYDKITRHLQGSKPNRFSHAKAGIIMTRKQTGGRNDH